MQACGFEGENKRVQVPASHLSGEHCPPLMARVDQDEDGRPRTVTCWKLTADELAEVNRTARVWLVNRGAQLPRCYLAGVRPFEVDEAPAS